jgi:hypothetical protein
MLKLSYNVNAYIIFKYIKKNMDVGISLGKLKELNGGFSYVISFPNFLRNPRARISS